MRGPSAKPQWVTFGRFGELGHLHQRGNARARAPRHHAQPLDHESAVEAGQRHHVAHGRQRHEVEELAQIRRRPGG